MPAPHKKSLAVTLTVLILASLSLVALAWFAGYKRVGKVDFLTSSNAKLPHMDMWMYHSKNDFGSSNQSETEGWVSQPVVRDEEKFEYFSIPAATPVLNGDGSTASYVFSSLHFGKVDNLVALKNDNKVLLRFFFDKTSLNNEEGRVQHVSFTLSYNTSGYEYDAPANQCVLDSVYLLKEVAGGVNKVNLREPANQEEISEAESEGKTPPDPTYILECREDEPRAMQFLQIRYAVSATKYEPSGDGFVDGKNELIPLSNPVPINCGSAGAMKEVTEDVTDENGTTAQVTSQIPICEACVEGTCGQAKLTADDLEGVLEPIADGKYNIGDGFYVYIELAPLLDAYGMQENILDYFVPAYMFFDVKLDVEIG